MLNLIKRNTPAIADCFIIETTDRINGKNYYDAEKHNEGHLSRCRVIDYFRTIIEKSAFTLDNYENTVRASDKVEMFCMFFGSDEELSRCKKIF